MENASKALIIAGAILISILLIGGGVAIVSSISEVVDEATTTTGALTASMHNSKLDNYVGKNVTGAVAREFIASVITSNSGSDVKEPILINAYKIVGDKFTHKYKTTDLKQIYNGIVSGAMYSIKSTSGCSRYSGGIRSDGTYGCISITKL